MVAGKNTTSARGGQSAILSASICPSQGQSSARLCKIKERPFCTLLMRRSCAGHVFCVVFLKIITPHQKVIGKVEAKYAFETI